MSLAPSIESIKYVNQSEFKINESYHTKLYWQEKNGNFLFIDVLNISVLCPMSVFGVFLNMLCLRIFNCKCLSTKYVYKYFKVYSINSIIICAMFSICFLFKTPNILEFTNSYTARFILLKIRFPIFAIVYYYLSLLDIFISLERISHFLIRFKKLRSYNPYKVCFLLFLLSILLNLTYTFVYGPGSVTVKLNDQTNYTIYKTVLTSYGESKIGKINILAIYITRDVFILFIVIFLNILTIILLRRHLKERKELLNINEENILLMNSINTRLTVMVIVMLTISSLEHFVFLLSYFYYILYENNLLVSSIWNFVSISGIVIKQISNFFIFYSFNRVFRAKLKHFF